MVKDSLEIVREIAQAIYDKKGKNIIAIDVRGISSMTDYVIIADGNVDRHVIALANGIQELMQQKGERALHVEGMQTGDWVVIDCFRFMVHLLIPEMRQKYQLERLWPDGAVIDLKLTDNTQVGHE